MSITLNASQEEAYEKIKAFLIDPNRKYFILSGGPGYGKSTLINYMMKNLNQDQALLAKVLSSSSFHDVKFSATTNSAADSLTSIDGSIPTIHSLLNLIVQGGQLVQRNNVDLRNSVLVVDEYTLIDHTLFEYLDTATAKVILVGDADQLLAVKGMSRYLVNRTPDHILDIPMRTSSKEILAVIESFKNLVRDRETTPLDTDHFKDVVWITRDEFIEGLENDSLDLEDSRIITHTNAMAIQFNQLIRQARGFPEHFIHGERVYLNRYARAGNWNYKTDSEYIIESFDGSYVNNDGVQYENYTVIDMSGNRHAFHTDKFDLRSVFASTVYKAQGRSFDTIYIDLEGFPTHTSRTVLTRALYVGASRARTKVVFVGELPDNLLERL